MCRLFSRRAARSVAGALLVVVIVALALGPLAYVIESFDGGRISGWVEAAGIWGPILIVSLMMIAIVATPIPSAPIALAAEAAYACAMPCHPTGPNSGV